jgi:histidyl-tRNA synthetase
MSRRSRPSRAWRTCFPTSSPLWEKLEDTCRDVFRQYGYRNIRTPIVEPTALFVRGIGEVTGHRREGDVRVRGPQRREPRAASRGDRGNRALRDRAQLLYNGPMRVWTVGPCIATSGPQKGRQRQSTSSTSRRSGFDGPDVDAEQIVMLARLWKRLGSGPRASLNSDRGCDRPQVHREKLIAYFERHAAILDEDAKRRLHTNPLRILDSKNPAMQAMIEDAPMLIGRARRGRGAPLRGAEAPPHRGRARLSA